MLFKCLLPIIFLIISIPNQLEAADKVVCYYESWAAYSGVIPEDLDASLCTHVNYAFIGVSADGNLQVEDNELDIDQGLFYRTTDMKHRNGNLKVLLSVGGASASSSQTFAAIASNPAARATFIGSAKYFIETFYFDGLDIDWEYPEEGDRGNYISLLREVKNEFDQHGWLLTAAVAANPQAGYNVGEMAGILDFINIMTYDMYGPWSSYTGQNSPLYASSVESEWEKQNLNVAAAAKNWVNSGVPSNKLIIGVAFYGRTFELADANQHGLHAPINGPGIGDGYIDYRSICSTYAGWERIWDDEQKNPYKISGNQWLGYDDGDSIWIKAQYAKDNNYGGVMIWAIDGDDVHGSCGRNQDLLHNINTVLFGTRSKK